MITVIAGTNRENSKANIIANHYLQLLKEQSEESQLLCLDSLPLNFMHPQMYSSQDQNKELATIQNKYIIPASKFIFVVSEYNGSFPGILKLFIDACSVREISSSFYGKKAGLVGVSSGRAGCLLGMDHLSSILNYLKLTILPNKLPISSIDSLISERGEIIDELTKKSIHQHVNQFIEF